MDVLTTEKRTYESIQFSGTTNEYFKIWIVNLALTIVTLGIYSAWAKVRKERYFYSNTALAGANFDYHAKPTAILFGRVIAVIMLGAYLVSGYLHPFAPFGVIIIIFLASPWLIVRSRIFRMRVSSYRGIRFNFQPAYFEAFKAFYGAAVVTVVSFGLATATANFMRSRFAVAYSGFGQQLFRFNGEHSAFVEYFWKSVGLGVLVVLGATTFATMVLPLLPLPEAGDEFTIGDEILILLTNVPLLVGYLAIGVYYQTRVRNYLWNTSTLGSNHFLSTLSAFHMFHIYVTNLLAIVFSVGLATPWAQIRLARYRAEHLEVALADNWQDILANKDAVGSALGDEIGGAFDVELDIGI